MSSTFLPCGLYHESYAQDQAWWQTPVIRVKMILLFLFLFVIFPLLEGRLAEYEFWGGVFSFAVFNKIGYYVLGALGVQLLIGFCGQVTLGHAAFIAVGAYTSTLLVLQVPWPQFMVDYGLAYPLSVFLAAVTAGLWSVLFGLPSAKVKGFYLILTTMAAQFVTVDFILTQYVSQIGGRGQAFSLPPGTIKIGPWVMDTNIRVYYLMLVLVVLCCVMLINLLRSRVGRAWVAIRDNDIAAGNHGDQHRRIQAARLLRCRVLRRRGRRVQREQPCRSESGIVSVVPVPVAGGNHPYRRRRIRAWGYFRRRVHGSAP